MKKFFLLIGFGFFFFLSVNASDFSYTNPAYDEYSESYFITIINKTSATIKVCYRLWTCDRSWVEYSTTVPADETIKSPAGGCKSSTGAISYIRVCK